ncbi:hypothetical protein [Paraburkholderia saeva]|uniref:hypothetical protein n=1 Tax=Paraburkholderia saeva TaxID=2777537 RepID=UPI001E3C7CEE|nr:hypothetical protein [Paraburkholderia saeva]
MILAAARVVTYNFRRYCFPGSARRAPSGIVLCVAQYAFAVVNNVVIKADMNGSRRLTGLPVRQGWIHAVQRLAGQVETRRST